MGKKRKEESGSDERGKGIFFSSLHERAKMAENHFMSDPEASGKSFRSEDHFGALKKSISRETLVKEKCIFARRRRQRQISSLSLISLSLSA